MCGMEKHGFYELKSNKKRPWKSQGQLKRVYRK